MAAKVIHTEIDGKKLKLTNLDKVLYPQANITKAEIIQYYIQHAETILPYMSKRPLTLIRYPDGIDQHQFYSKSRPDWTPEWINSYTITHDERSIEYIYIESAAGLVWIANLAGLEIHPMQFKVGQENPDYFVFDLDPDDNLDFNEVKIAAKRLKEILVSKDYQPFVKTSGGKGLHILVPIVPNYTFEEVKETSKIISQILINQYPKEYTLNISKGKRKGKILIDIYRNHLTNTTVAPYSLRGKSGAPISMPISWDNLEHLESPQNVTLKNVNEHMSQSIQAWSHWHESAGALHNHKYSNYVKEHKVDARLDSYIDKRDLDNTPEPIPEIFKDYKNQFCIQLHDASNLHYDLRLEHDGVLWSWAIPKGLPIDPMQKRLAIRTEDHPVKYLRFEGVIPKGSYGAGKMWTLKQGLTKWSHKKERKLEFAIDGDAYKLINTNEDKWLITTSQVKECITIESSLSPMLADSVGSIPVASNYKYEVKWDGIRVLIYLQDDQVRIISRNGKELTKQFGELLDPDVYKVESGVFDGEIVVLDDQGRPIFADVISRMHSKKNKTLHKTKPVTCYLFDVLSIDGIDLIDESLSRRRAIMQSCVRWGETMRFSRSFDDGSQLFDAIEAKSMEGIMAKDQDSRYHEGSRTKDWLKIKCRKQIEVIIIGYTKGKGDRSGLFGALHVTDGDGVYKGKVGTGFDHRRLKELFGELNEYPKVPKPIEDIIEEESRTVWIESELKCLVEYASLTPNNTLREPVFIKMKR